MNTIERAKEAGMKSNLTTTERVITGAVAAGLAAFAWKKSSATGRILAGVGSGALGVRAATGYCPMKQAVVDYGATENAKPTRIEKVAMISAPVELVYEFWNNVENFPKFMSHLESVTKMSDTTSHWISKGPLGMNYEWDSEIVKNVPNDVIAWHSVTGDVPNSGEVRFKRVGHKTRVKVRLEYAPPAGTVGETVAWLFGSDPKSQLEEYIPKMRKLIESNPSVEQIRAGAFKKEMLNA
jgi:uncharacterized membrane protein